MFEFSLFIHLEMVEPFGRCLYRFAVWRKSAVYLTFQREWALVLSSVLTFAIIILCATGSKTMAMRLLLLSSGLGLGAGEDSLDIVRWLLNEVMAEIDVD